MNVILCIDDDCGMMFNNRRQSRDRCVIEDIIKLLNGRPLFVNEYSAELFAGYDVQLKVSADFMDRAEVGDFCFVENIRLLPFKNDINSITVYKWNRLYPADIRLDINPQDIGSVASVSEIKGYSHENITKEVYVINEKK